MKHLAVRKNYVLRMFQDKSKLEEHLINYRQLSYL